LPMRHKIADRPSEARRTGWALTVLILIVYPSIKLFSREGTPWTQAWGYMFLASFFVLEIILYLGKEGKQEKPGDWESQFSYDDPAIICSEFLTAAAILIHIGLLSWAFNGIVQALLPADLSEQVSSAWPSWDTLPGYIFAFSIFRPCYCYFMRANGPCAVLGQR